jgi:uncharacterized membrane protein YvlD (DUF360 family)
LGIKFVVVTLVFAALVIFVPTLKARDTKTILIAAPAMGLANVTLGWVMTFVGKVLLFLPNLLTLGLIGLLIPIVVNAILIKGIDLKFGKALTVQGFPPLVGSAVVISVAAFVAGLVV